MTEDPFVTHRSLLFTVAYEMLGSAADAEDVVQETWLRWADVDHAEVRDPRAYLVRIVTRQALNRLRTLARRREEYVGRVAARAAADQPRRRRGRRARRERLDRDAHRARDARAGRAGGVRAARGVRRALRRDRRGGRQDAGRGPPDRPPGARARRRAAAADRRSTAPSSRQVVDRFLAAVRTGDLQGLLDVLAPDVVLVADGGGVVAAARRPVVGPRPGGGAPVALPTVAPDARGRHRVAQRRARRPDRPRRRARHGGQPRRSRTAGSPASTRSATRTSSPGSTRRPTLSR